MTRNGRVFAPALTQRRNDEPLAKSKGKEMTGPAQIPESPDETSSPKANSFQKEVEEFLGLPRKALSSGDQLNHHPSKILILSLLLNFEAHRESLMKVMGVAHMMKDITVDQFDGVVTNITKGSFMGFSDDELPSKGRSHNRALHILMNCMHTILSRVLVDTWSSLNVMPKTTLIKLMMDGVSMKPNALIVKAFDGSRQDVIGEVDPPINISPHTFSINFQVMKNHPAYNCLLGSPWIHVAGEVTSTLHQKLKFIIGNKMIIMDGEE